MATEETIWLGELLKELRFEQCHSTLLQQDNQSTITLTKNPIHHARTKHIDIQHHFIRECVESDTIYLEYIPIEHMMADSLTKALSKAKHDLCIQEMGIDI